MDSKSNGMAWVSKLCQKTETFFAEMDDLISEEPLKYVENQLVTAGENVKQFCSGFIQDVFYFVEEEVPSSLPELNEKFGGLASEMMSLGLDEGHQKGSCNSDSSVHELPVEPFEQLHNDSPCKKQYDIGMNMGIEDNAEAGTLFFSETSEVIASVNENSNDISVFCGVRQPNTEGSDDQVNLSADVSVEFQEDLSISELREMNSAPHAKDDVSPLLPTVHSNISFQPHECRFLDIGLNSCDNALSTVSDDSHDSLQPEFEPCNTSEEFTTLSFPDVSDGISAEADRINFTKQGMSTITPTGKLKLDDSCIVVDCNEISSASEAKHLYHQKYLSRAFSSILKFAKEQKHKKATLSKDLDKESDVPRGIHLTPPSATTAFESMDRDFSESEWEIV